LIRGNPSRIPIPLNFDFNFTGRLEPLFRTSRSQYL
jgi:hypothetical protein